MGRHLMSVLVFVLLSVPLRAAPVVADQAVSNCFDCVGIMLAEATSHVGQSVTAGVTGHLVRLDLNAMTSSIDTSWELIIGLAPDGMPNGTILHTQEIVLSPLQDTSAWTSVMLSRQLFMRENTGFVISLHPTGVNGALPFLAAGIWMGGMGDPYGRGRAFYGTANSRLFPAEAMDPACTECWSHDLFFRTYVQPSPVPDVPTFACVAAGILSILTAGWRSRHADARRRTRRALSDVAV
jgi:hypothetical protein